MGQVTTTTRAACAVKACCGQLKTRPPLMISRRRPFTLTSAARLFEPVRALLSGYIGGQTPSASHSLQFSCAPGLGAAQVPSVRALFMYSRIPFLEHLHSALFKSLWSFAFAQPRLQLLLQRLRASTRTDRLVALLFRSRKLKHWSEMIMRPYEMWSEFAQSNRDVRQCEHSCIVLAV